MYISCVFSAANSFLRGREFLAFMDCTAVEQSEKSSIANARGQKHTIVAGAEQRNFFAGLYSQCRCFILFL
jgi:hypothetical protein